jgi:hypothetical protein
MQAYSRLDVHKDTQFTKQFFKALVSSLSFFH